MMRTSGPGAIRFGIACLGASLTLSAGATTAAQNPARSTESVVATASKYVEDYRKQFSAILCEEQQTQTLVTPAGRISKTRVLVSELTFVTVGDGWMLHAFRDVISVDGKPVRNRDERIRKLFLEGKKDAVAQAQAIAEESGRYNLGIRRVGNSPLLPVMLLDPHLVANFTFKFSDPVLTFEEQKRPTFLGFTRDGRHGDLPASGSMVIAPETGAILSATLTAEAPEAPVSTTFTVTYDVEPALKMRVPATMKEQYHLPAKPKEDHFESRMTYSAFRRFEVSASVKIK